MDPSNHQEMKPKAETTPVQKAGWIVLLAGIAVMAVGILYEASNLPWRTYLQNIGILRELDELPDPSPIGAQWVEPVFQDVQPEMIPKERRFLIRNEVKLELYGYLKLPKIDISENVLAGSDEELNYGVGHIAGTALPGEKGNCVLAGHRNYIPMHPFRNLDQMEIGDRVIFEDQVNRYVYEVYEILDVPHSQIDVLDPVEGEESTLSLLTCTPVTTMTRRLVVRSRLVSTDVLPPKA